MNPLESAEVEHESLLRQKADIESRIEAVAQSIAILKPFYGKGKTSIAELMTDLPHLGITEAVERLLASRPYELTYPTQVRDLLEDGGYSMRGDNQLATIHTILKRLAARENGKVFQTNDAAGKVAYEYRDIGTIPRHLIGEISPKGLALSPELKTAASGQKLKDALNNAGKK